MIREIGQLGKCYRQERPRGFQCTALDTKTRQGYAIESSETYIFYLCIKHRPFGNHLEIVEHLLEEWECMLNLMHALSSFKEGWGCQIFIRTIYSGWVVHEDSFAIRVMVAPEHETYASDHYPEKETAFTPACGICQLCHYSLEIWLRCNSCKILH